MVVFVVLAQLLFSTSFFNPVVHSIKNFSFLDAFYHIGLEEKDKIDDRIVLINIEDLNNAEIVGLIEKVLSKNPATLGVDVLFKNEMNPATFAQLKRLIQRENVVVPYILKTDGHRDYGILNQISNTSGMVNLYSTDKIMTINAFQGIQQNKGNKDYALASQILKVFQLGNIWKQFGYEGRLVARKRIKFYGHFKDFTHYHAKTEAKKLQRADFHEKIVLLGYAGIVGKQKFDIEDKHYTPLNENSLGKGVPDMYGMVLHANILNMLLSNDLYAELNQFQFYGLIFGFCFLTSLLFIWLDTKLKISYRTARKSILLLFAIVLVGLTLWLFSVNIVIEPSLIVISVWFTASFTKYYKHLVKALKVESYYAKPKKLK